MPAAVEELCCHLVAREVADRAERYPDNWLLGVLAKEYGQFHTQYLERHVHEALCIAGLDVVQAFPKFPDR